MADENAAGQLGQQPTPQPAPIAAPSQSLSPEDYQRLTRAEQQYKGALPVIQAANRFGLKSSKDFETYGPVIQTLRDKGIDPQQFTAAFSSQVQEQAQDQGVEPNQLSHRDIERMVGEKLTAMKADMIREQAQAEHDKAMNSEYDELERDDFYSDALGDLKDSKEGRELLRYAAIGRHLAGTDRKEYSDGPLKGKFGPAGRDGLGSIKNWLGSSFKGIVTGLKAGQAAGIGAAARNGVAAGTVGGNSGSQGLPGNTPDKGRPGGLPSKAKLEEALSRRGIKPG